MRVTEAEVVIETEVSEIQPETKKCGPPLEARKGKVCVLPWRNGALLTAH